MKKTMRICSLLLAFCICFGLLSFVKANATVIQKEVTIYALDNWAEEYISIPDDKLQSYQLAVSDSSYVRVVSGESVTVNQDGTVSPAFTTWYFLNGVGSTVSSGDPDEKVVVECEYGTSVISVVTDDVEIEYTVNVENYATVYAEAIVDEYILNNITDDMTFEEKLDKICAMPASYDYSPYASGAVSMIVKGGGDCWASTSLIVWLCNKLGIQAWSRNANMDLGAGSGHMNAVIFDGVDTYYIAEAGYDEKAPRYYNVTKLSSAFMCRYLQDGVEVYQYIGIDVDVLDIPDRIDGYPVVSISKNFMTMDERVKEIIIPDTVKEIGYSAFNSCENLEKINIPASVEVIGDFAFTNCNKLENIECADDNEYFKVVDGVLYSKDEKTLLFCPAGVDVAVSDKTQTIADYAFYYNYNLKSVSIPDGVSYIGEGAFGDCVNLCRIDFAEGDTLTIGDFAFYYSINLKNIFIPSRLKSIGEKAFYHSAVEHIVYAGTQNQWEDIDIASNGNECFDTSVVHFEAQGSVVSEDIVLPTCNEKGYTACLCSLCDFNVVSDYADEIGHNIVNGVCLNCGLDEFLCVESPHNYPNNYDNTWVITRPNAKCIEIVFSEKTMVENFYDYIYIYDADDVQIGKYTGNSLSGRKITVDGDTVKIRLVSDATGDDYGFDLSGFEVIYDDGTDTDTSTEYDTDVGAVTLAGDIDENGVVDIIDVVLARAHIVGTRELSGRQILMGDMDGDKLIDIIDVVMMRSKIVNGFQTF